MNRIRARTEPPPRLTIIFSILIVNIVPETSADFVNFLSLFVPLCRDLPKGFVTRSVKKTRGNIIIISHACSSAQLTLLRAPCSVLVKWKRQEETRLLINFFSCFKSDNDAGRCTQFHRLYLYRQSDSNISFQNLIFYSSQWNENW